MHSWSFHMVPVSRSYQYYLGEYTSNYFILDQRLPVTLTHCTCTCTCKCCVHSCMPVCSSAHSQGCVQSCFLIITCMCMNGGSQATTIYTTCIKHTKWKVQSRICTHYLTSNLCTKSQCRKELVTEVMQNIKN